MPVATSPPAILTRLLRHRLETSLPADQREVTCNALSNLLYSVWNARAVTETPPPADRTSRWPMAQIYQRLAAPVAGSPFGPLSADEHRTLQLVHYLHEVEAALPLDPGGDPAVRRPQSQIHAHLLHELRREFSLLPVPVTLTWRELAVSDIAVKLLAKAERLGFQPTEVRALGAQQLDAVTGVHRGGMKLTLVAWNGAAPPERSHAAANPNVWDPGNPLGNELDLLLAPLQMDWTGLTPLPR
ncbi:hypothetical protein [Stenotrophomonas rhizophila]|uniref:hypothetical protein n=1 Tax=Stenotrophomonas rhizophila TaxID=216778 RepID=UPI00081CD204|nr:hypothetical protein [Stenotrophomonas rhizophila]AOA70486.1 hypothetical protein BAY15_0052 [Stenotrophomonas rhizophila]